MQRSNTVLFGVGVLLCALAAGYHFRYLLMKTELRRGTLVFDQRPQHAECHLVDTKRVADVAWPVKGFGSGEVSEEAFAKMFRISDGLEASFCESHPDLLNQEIAVRGVRVDGDAIGQDCMNRDCFRWVRLEQPGS